MRNTKKQFDGRKFRVEPERNVRCRSCSKVTARLLLPCFYGSGHSFAENYIRCTIYHFLDLLATNYTALNSRTIKLIIIT